MFRYSIRHLLFIAIGFAFFQSCKNDQGRITSDPIDFIGIKGQVNDLMTKEALPARIIITDSDSNQVDSYYTHLPGFFTKPDGSFEKELAPGKYQLDVYHGFDYQSMRYEFEVFSDKGIEVSISLTPWINLKQKGWVNGYGHNHLYTDKKPDIEMADRVRKICLAQGIDFICAVQGWSGFNDDTWKDGYKAFTDDNFTLYYGSEMPKYRTGHTWWLGQESTLDYFHSTMDTVYENQYYQSAVGTHWNFKSHIFPNIPDVEVVQRIKEQQNAVAIMPHPTSWWWQKRGDIEKYTTNVSSYMAYGLLAGKIWDGLVVMGYNHDHISYQNLWFNILNQGYRMPAIGELDGGYRKNDRFYYGSMRTYFKIKGDFAIDKIVEAVRSGNTFVTSGPMIMADIDQNYEYGDVIRIDGKDHTLNIDAYSSGDIDEYLSWVVIYRNGKVFNFWDLREKKSRKFNASVTIQENEQSWYVVKAYGSKAVQDPKFLDIFWLNDKSIEKEMPHFGGDRYDVCITSPFYFWPENYNDPEPLISSINLKLKDPKTENLIKNADIDILVQGVVVESLKLSEGNLSFQMPIHAMLRIRCDGYPEIRRGLYMDYYPHLKLMEELASGDWMKSQEHRYGPGEVPWEAFNYEKTKDLLSYVEWEIEMTPNERDPQWKEFDSLFQ